MRTIPKPTATAEIGIQVQKLWSPQRSGKTMKYEIPAMPDKHIAAPTMTTKNDLLNFMRVQVA
jgi:hypothetical protein